MLVEWQWVLAGAKPGVLVSETPGKECSAHSWVVDEASSKSILVNLCLLEFSLIEVRTARAADIHLSDMDLKTELAESFDGVGDVLTVHIAAISINMELKTHSVNRNFLLLH